MAGFDPSIEGSLLEHPAPVVWSTTRVPRFFCRRRSVRSHRNYCKFGLQRAAELAVGSVRLPAYAGPT